MQGSAKQVIKVLPNNSGQGCIFCKKLKKSGFLMQNEFSFAILDGSPVSSGHTLVIPKRHITDYFDMTEIQQNAVDLFKELITTKHPFCSLSLPVYLQ